MTMESIKILLIEDNPGDARLIQEYLNENNLDISISTVKTLEQGLEAINTNHYDALLLDLGLPDSQGLGSLAKVHQVNDKLPVIILTGASEDLLGTASIQAGAQDYLAKDEINARLLSRTINYAIERKKLEIENLILFDKSNNQLSQLIALREIDLAITQSLDLENILEIVTRHGIRLLGVDAIGILLVDSSNKLKFIKSQGIISQDLFDVEINIGKGISGMVAESQKPTHIQNLLEFDGYPTFTELLVREGFLSLISYPLIAKNEVVGVIELYSRSVIQPESEWWSLLESVSGQSAIAIHNAKLFEMQKQSQEELINAYEATIEGWALALEIRDKETQGHTFRVTEITMELLDSFDIPPDLRVHIKRGVLLHDIGKLIIPDEILHKPGKLTEDEWEIMRQHPVVARDLLEKIDYLHPAIIIPYYHHEKWDGTGYPQGLKGEEIPLSARIFSIVDVWDALNSDRPYRKAWPREKCIQYIKDQSGIHFDPKVVEVFLKKIEKSTF